MAKDLNGLSDVEKDKIRFGELHFKAVSSEIIFDWVNSYKSFKAKILF
jgi:type III restriction enzyme